MNHSSIDVYDGKLQAETYAMAPKGRPQVIQSVIWGRNAYDNLLYATSDSPTAKGATAHKVIDVETGKARNFGDKGEGESLDVNLRGTL